ncbi:hypothetical protein [Tenacibaculum ovolyticum]|uniref:hypothetical protein n=1 Tax=Tenacibaculum ovolyticum TaxID=104270 RepID=UPI0007ED3A52|nr:hypothetical protein [Tenacibaculum ovolyticum]
MKRKYYMRILFFLSFLTISSCKSQTVVKLQNEGKDSVSYEIITDSVYCARYENNKGYLKFELLKVAHHNKSVQDSLNIFFLLKQKESFEMSSNIKVVDFKSFKEGVLRSCGNEVETPSLAWFDIVFNDRNVFTVGVINYDWNGKGHRVSYNFSLKTGKVLQLSDVFNAQLVRLLDDLKQRMLKDLEIDYKISIKKIEKDKYRAKELKKVIEEGFNSFYEFIINEKGIELFISFGKYASERRSFNLSFEELKPYLTKDFKEQIDIK